MRCGRVGGQEELTRSTPMGSTSHSGDQDHDDVKICVRMISRITGQL